MSLCEAVIVVAPALIPVTSPALLTEATMLFELTQDTSPAVCGTTLPTTVAFI